ncbi:mitochondrial carnitine/acylcarnitine carrier protein isoform X1 [Octopus bimaculoides]|nr:mitochondrial carnitine/acylcarnitine carrier protein isoform X1 [Octopus bimaculoides]|eukprot:XP_014770350.1 PREDICTED: mitochondrial carnitine/acylcarnitine carrier protein-like [Octopus bimaculoides]
MSKEISPRKDFIAGYFGGVAIVVAGYPMDTIKVRIQTMPQIPGQPSPYRNMYDCGMHIIKRESVRGLYKGMAIPLVIIPPMFALWFFTFGVGKKLQQKSPQEQLSYFQVFKAGMLAGTVATAFCSPGERIKCLLQIQQESNGKAKYQGPIDCLRKLYKEGGIRWIYRGTTATFVRDIHGSGFYFMTYEFMQRLLSEDNKRYESLSARNTLLAGGVAGLVNWSLALPADVVKSRIQIAPIENQNLRIKDVFKQLWKEGGIQALYKGTTPVLTRAFVGNAACLLTYEIVVRVLNTLLPNL